MDQRESLLLLKGVDKTKDVQSCEYDVRTGRYHVSFNSERLTNEEYRYAFHPNTHVDFMIYNQISKAPVLAIEVDGVQFHRKGTRQAQRDQMKNEILKKYGIRLLRLPTNGSGELEKVRNILTGGDGNDRAE